jgi:acetyl esterase/lipase
MPRFRRVCRLFLRLVLAFILLGLIVSGSVWWYLHPAVTEARGIVYAERHGHPLTLNVYRPAHPNGIGVLVMVSGSWKSHPERFQSWLVAPYLREGQTIFAVSHLSQPEATIMEIVEDVQHAVRFVRSHAKDYGIDPLRLGVTGASSGGHLSLMLATCGGVGDANSPDPVEHESSVVQAAAVFFPVTDLLNLGPSTQNLGDGGPPKSFRKSFGPKADDLNEWKLIGHDVSPIYHITKDMPPIFIAHGDADTLVPLDQSVRFKARAAELGRDVSLTIRPGEKHGWLMMLWDIHIFACWLTEHLPPTSQIAGNLR